MTIREEIKKQAFIYTDDASNYTEWSDGCTDSNDLLPKQFENSEQGEE